MLKRGTEVAGSSERSRLARIISFGRIVNSATIDRSGCLLVEMPGSGNPERSDSYSIKGRLIWARELVGYGPDDAKVAIRQPGGLSVQTSSDASFWIPEDRIQRVGFIIGGLVSGGGFIMREEGSQLMAVRGYVRTMEMLEKDLRSPGEALGKNGEFFIRVAGNHRGHRINVLQFKRRDLNARVFDGELYDTDCHSLLNRTVMTRAIALEQFEALSGA